MKVPCELIIWNILPAIRREFARILVEDFNLTQRETAKKLGVTESAVSQYLKFKRGKEVKFDKRMINEIGKAIKDVTESEKDSLLIEKTCSICALIRNYGILCKLHRADNAKLGDCDVCLPDMSKTGCL